jgi:hypothetical protein
MIRVKIPVEAGNASIQSGRLPRMMERILGELKPEAAYFTSDGGIRTALFFVDLKDVADIPKLAEPFFMELNASVELLPVMNAEDLKRGLGQIPSTAGA